MPLLANLTLTVSLSKKKNIQEADSKTNHIFAYKNLIAVPLTLSDFLHENKYL